VRAFAASHGGSEKIIGVLKQMEAGRKVANPARDLGASEATIYTWRSKYSGLG
jgi:putative transposase